MWDPNIGMGTVTHQNIGYLWPMGPYYWLMDAIGLPDWVAQRLWLGSIILLAGLGVRWMLRELRWDGAGVTVASFAYALSPYLLEYAARISVILLPFAGLPWLIGLAARALRRRDWATPAVFALVTLTVGGVNATSLILVMFGPLLWFLHATFVAREVTFGQALATGLRITVLTAVTSLWWVAGLMIQGAYGIPILRYTETYETVAAAALAPEVLRGLGYWFFYGTDGLGAWTASTVRYVESVPSIALSYLIPGLGLAGGLLTRWRHRVFFASIIVVGLVLSVGAHPWESPSPYGRVFRAWARGDLGLSFRSTPRAAPLVILGLAVVLGAGVAALSRWRPRLHLPVTAALLVLICANQLPLFQGQLVDRNLVRDEDVPEYWTEAAGALDAGDPATRVYEVPGIDFAAYRWGNTVDPITPGLTDREYVARELIPYGSPASAELLSQVEAPFQSGRPEPDALAPLARFMGVGQIVFRADTQYERYRTPRPRRTLAQLTSATGLADPVGFGDAVPNRPDGALRLDDEVELATPVDDPDPSPVMLFDVEDARPILRTVSGVAPQVMGGDAAGLVALAAVGGLAADRPVFYSATFADDAEGLDALLAEPDASLVVTDTNRKQGTRWGSVRDNDGYTERAGEEPLETDLADNRLDVFPDADDDHRTVVEQRGGATAAASAYGNNVTYTPGDRATKAVDGDESTGWKVGAFDDPTGEYLVITTDEPVTTDRVTLLQNPGDKNRWISDVTLTFDGEDPVAVALDGTSRTSPGQVVTFPERTFDTLRITIDRTDPADAPSFRGLADVGFAESRSPAWGRSTRSSGRVDLLDAAGEESIDRASPACSPAGAATASSRTAPREPTMRRFVGARRAPTRPTAGRGCRWTSDDVVDRLVGVPTRAQGGVTATSSERLPGDLRSRASSAVDGDPLTAYQTPINGSRASGSSTPTPNRSASTSSSWTWSTTGCTRSPTVTLSVDGGPGQQVDCPSPRSPPTPPVVPPHGWWANSTRSPERRSASRSMPSPRPTRPIGSAVPPPSCRSASPSSDCGRSTHLRARTRSPRSAVTTWSRSTDGRCRCAWRAPWARPPPRRAWTWSPAVPPR
jgi:arabinofuranan 3-O-arabinosyltransferase